METLLQHQCKHCGNQCRAGIDFCCQGCNIAFQLITGSGFEEFYSKKNNNTLAIPDENFNQFIDLEFNTQTIIEKLGPSTNQIRLLIENVTCSACAWLLEKIPAIDKNITAVSYSPSTHMIIVQYNANYPIQNLANTFYRLGYPVHVVTLENTSQLDKKTMRSFYIKTAVAFASMIATMHVSLSLLAGLLDGMESVLIRSLGLSCLALSLPTILYAAVPFYKNTYLSIKTKQIHIDVLVSLTILVTLVSGTYNIINAHNEFYFDAMTTLVAFILAARLLVKELENRFYSKNSVSILDLINKSFDIKKDQVVTVKSGSTFPCDGVILSGNSLIDTSWLTGESKLSPASEGSFVLAGTINKGDLVTIKATATGSNTEAAKILKILNETDKNTTQIKTEKIEKLFVLLTVYFIGGITLINIFIPLLSWSKIVALVIILCPCALGLAIPLTFSSAIRQALKKGIYFSNSQALDKLNQIGAVVFDKTGTLTKKEFKITRELWMESELMKYKLNIKELKNILSSMAVRSNHLLLRSFYNPLLEPIVFSYFKEHFSKGIEAKYQNLQFKFGSAHFVSHQIPTDDKAKLYMSIQDVVCASFELEQQIDEKTIRALDKIKSIHEVYILSGDNKKAVEAAAQIFNIKPDHAFYSQTPESKLEFINNIAKTQPVMMVGDGVNDLLAIKKSHLSVGLFEEKKLALNQADILLQQDQLYKLPMLFNAGRKIKAVVNINLAWALAFNLVGISLVLLGIVGPVISAFLMPLSSLIVVLFAVNQRYFI